METMRITKNSLKKTKNSTIKGLGEYNGELVKISLSGKIAKSIMNPAPMMHAELKSKLN